MLLASMIATWVAFWLTCAVPPRSRHLRPAKLFLAFSFTWLVVEVVRETMLSGTYY